MKGSMACYGCGETFRDKGGVVIRSTHYSLCYECAYRVLQTRPCDIAELATTYANLKKKGIWIPEELVRDIDNEMEERYLNPTDRMFNPRSN